MILDGQHPSEESADAKTRLGAANDTHHTVEGLRVLELLNGLGGSAALGGGRTTKSSTSMMTRMWRSAPAGGKLFPCGPPYQTWLQTHSTRHPDDDQGPHIALRPGGWLHGWMLCEPELPCGTTAASACKPALYNHASLPNTTSMVRCKASRITPRRDTPATSAGVAGALPHTIAQTRTKTNEGRRAMHLPHDPPTLEGHRPRKQLRPFPRPGGAWVTDVLRALTRAPAAGAFHERHGLCASGGDRSVEADGLGARRAEAHDIAPLLAEAVEAHLLALELEPTALLTAERSCPDASGGGSETGPTHVAALLSVCARGAARNWTPTMVDFGSLVPARTL